MSRIRRVAPFDFSGGTFAQANSAKGDGKMDFFQCMY